MTALGDALTDLFDDLMLEAGVSLSVTRDTTTSSVDAIRGRAFTDRFGDEQGYAASHEDDFIVKVADWIALVGPEPETTDVIQWTDESSIAHRYQIKSDGSERHFDPVGQFGLLWRIHCVEIG